MRMLVAWLLTSGVLALAAAGAALGAVMAPSPSRPAAPRLPALPGPIRSPGGPYLYDHDGRVVILHGVNVVYKRPPFEVYPDRRKPWNFDAADARTIARLGFDVVRLGIVWQGLEPGTDPPNDPDICRLGTPGNPHQLRLRALQRYLDHVRQTVDLLARFHIFTILDMHQDVYSSVLGGEGAPRWAVCTNGVRPTRPPGRWSLIYGTEATDIAYHHFWRNNVVGNLQGQYDEVWSLVARSFRHDPWVIGFDPFNEPFGAGALKHNGTYFDGTLECFYTGTAHVARVRTSTGRLVRPSCPSDDPRTGLIPDLRRADPNALVFVEPALYASRGTSTELGPMDFSHLVFNVHIYCGDRDPTTGNPLSVPVCATQEAGSFVRRVLQRRVMASPFQRRGPSMVVSEFGATSNPTLLRQNTAAFSRALVGWIYWSWRYYEDPTGSTDEALVRATGHLRATAYVLSQVYPEAIAGIPRRMSFDPTSSTFQLSYRTRRKVDAPTLIVVPTDEHYRHGYCASVSGGRVLSQAGSPLLEVSNGNVRHAHRVSVTVRPGRCRR
jgi:endoglycosylceramidase